MIKNLHFLLILGPKHDISKRRLKSRILTWFLRFFGQKSLQKNLKATYFHLTRQWLSIGV
jgi:hypothetical protein